MEYSSRTNSELIEKISSLEQRIKDLEQSEAACKQAEAALRSSEAKFKEIFETIEDLYYETDAAGTVKVLSPSLHRLAGLNEEDVIGRPAATFYVDPNDRERLFINLSKKGYVHDYEVLLKRKDGEELQASLSARLIIDDNGQPAGVRGLLRDITERKQAAKDLQESEAKYRSVVEDSLVGFYIIQDGYFRFVNNRFCEIFGYSYDEIVDTLRPYELTHPDDRILIDENVQKRIRGEIDRIEYDFRAIRKNSKGITVKVLGTSILYQGRTAAVGSIIDITSEKELENNLLKAQKMEAIGTMAGSIAHDFNNILTALIGYAILIQMKLNISNPLRAYVDQILMASQMATDLTRRLLSFSRQQPIALEPLDISNSITITTKLLGSLLTEDIKFYTSFTQADTVAMADSTQMGQVLFNLVANARDAMPKGGTLTIETAIVIIDNTFIKTHGFGQTGEYVRIGVSDTGIGMDDITRQKIFDPFFTTKETGKGTGLGLATVYGIVKRHKGYITVESTPGQGTAFQIYLPKADGGQAMKTIDTKRKETILVAKDNDEANHFVREALQAYGYQIIEVAETRDMIDTFRYHRDIDLVIIDSMMLKKNGTGFYEEIHRIDPHIKVLFTSGYTKDIVLEKGIKDKEFYFIAQPLSLIDLLQKVNEVFNRQ